MPRKTTDKEEKDGKKKASKSSSSKASKKIIVSPKVPSKKAKTGNVNNTKNEKRSQKKETIKKETKKKEITIENPTKDPAFLIKLFRIITSTAEMEKKVSNSKKVEKKKTEEVEPKKKTTISKKESTKKSPATTKTKKATPRKKKVVDEIPSTPILEYYDLPYRYNETVVKLLAQTPNILFVYWDISDNDRQRYVHTYGEDFFQNTKPVLIVHNKTKGYSFEVEINDFANSWYLHVDDTKCDYNIELGRRPRNEYVHIQNDYLYISSSNDLESPNDHILFEHLRNHIKFQNVKTGQMYDKYITTFLPANGKPFNIYELYQRIYGKELVTFSDRFDFSNPSSGNPSSTFR